MNPKIILDYGVNHEGDIYKAIAAIEIANNAKVHAIKFQHYNAKELKKDFDFNLKMENYQKIGELCNKIGMKWGISLFESTWNDVNLFKDMGINFLKIAANQNKTPEFINEVARVGLPVYVSYNVANMDHCSRLVHETDEILNVTKLVTKSEYPNMDLKSVLTFCDEDHGYSCHTPFYHSCITAALMGVSVIEKHFTLDHNTSDFRDHKHALDPFELTIMMDCMRAYKEISERTNNDPINRTKDKNNTRN